MTDDYQRRYLDHRRRKAEMLKQRRSIRAFDGREVPREALERIFGMARVAPQSCNRQAFRVKVFRGPQVHNLLAGGEGWLGSAPVVVLIFADMVAYKSPVEIAFMPWLDAGVILATIVYAATEEGIASCIVNPHIRPASIPPFQRAFNPDGHLFCGAVALGYAAIDPETPEKKPLAELVEWANE